MGKVTDTVSVFEKYAKHYQEKFSAYEPYIETYERLSTLIADGASVLDVACGPATISQYLLKRLPNLRVHGTDLAPAMIALAQEAIPNGVFELRDSRDIANINKRFNAVVAGFCIPYLDKTETEKLVRDARSLLTTRGILYLSTTAGDYADSAYQHPESEDRLYTFYYQEQFLIDLLTKYGFELLVLVRKPYPQTDKEDSTDLFFYARVLEI